MKMINTRSFFITFFVLNLVVVLYGISHSPLWLLNSQIAFIASLIVTFASYVGYKKMVSQKIANGEYTLDEDDMLEKLEDPHGLYEKEEDITSETLKEVIKEERAKIKGIKNSAVVVGKSAKGAFSVFRIVSYIVLILSFLYLNQHEMLDIWGYLTGLMIVPVGSFIVGVLHRG